MYRICDGKLQVLLAHPGGPFFKNKDDGAWSIPKGEVAPNESLMETATREFREETGFEPKGPFLELTPIKQKGGKTVHAWAFEGDCDPSAIVSNSFALQSGSKKRFKFPEIDRAEFFDVESAGRKINPRQFDLVKELERILNRTPVV